MKDFDKKQRRKTDFQNEYMKCSENIISGPDFFGDSFSKREDDEGVQNVGIRGAMESSKDMIFSGNQDEYDAMLMYQVSFTGP